MSKHLTIRVPDEIARWVDVESARRKNRPSKLWNHLLRLGLKAEKERVK